MSDIFDERASMRSAQEIAGQLRKMYNESVGPPTNDCVDVDTRIRHTKIALTKCSDELLMQIIVDVAQVLVKYGIDPREVKYI